MKKHNLKFETKYDLGHKIYHLYGHKILTYTLTEIRVSHLIVDESDRRFDKEIDVEYYYTVNIKPESFCDYDNHYMFGHFDKDFDRQKYTEDPEELIELLVDKVRFSLK
jgi:hypothetical protein